jgi:Flp pilus assembly protein TadD
VIASVTLALLSIPALRAVPASRDHVVVSIVQKDESRPATVTIPGDRPTELHARDHIVAEGARIDVPPGVTLVIASSEDKSRITLTPGSSLTLRSTGSGERVRLNSGNAVFVLLHNALDFFQVQYGDTFTANAHGTVFSVSVANHRVRFAVSEGTVAVTRLARLQIGPGGPESVVALEPATLRAVDIATAAKPLSYAEADRFVQRFNSSESARGYAASLLARAQQNGDPAFVVAAYYDRGVIEDRAGDFRGAVDDYNRALRLDSADPALYYQRGLAYDHNRGPSGTPVTLPAEGSAGNYERAIGLCTAEIAIAPTAGAYSCRAAAYYHSSDQRAGYERAVADYDRAIELNPRDGETYNRRGLANDFTGRLVAGAHDYETAQQRYANEVTTP